MAVNIVSDIDNLVTVNNVLVSVSDKNGLDRLIPGLLELNGSVHFYSTGGTCKAIEAILGKEKASGHLTQVSDYTKQPETQGGLVKTLDFKIYLGILTEKYNESHQEDLRRTAAAVIDMVVVNLYPFRETVARQGVTVEEARANIDIGGPCMVRASAKNYLRVASVVDPGDYDMILGRMKELGGRLDAATKFNLARKSFEHTAQYDTAIASFLAESSMDSVKSCYNFKDE